MAILNNILVEDDLRARKQTHRHVGFSYRGKTVSYFVDTSLSPTFAGRDLTKCRL
jgi:hypothetical protein